MRSRRQPVLLLLLLFACGPAAMLEAQEPSEQPMTRYVVDARLALPKVPDDDGLARPYGLSGVNLPGLGLGGDFGAHVYPVRLKRVAFGIGVGGVVGRAHASPVTQSNGTVAGKEVTARFSAIAPQISLNFGSAAGWSYLSAGIGTSRLEIRTPDTPPDTVWPRRKTVNYGGGGRWFIRDHVAVNFDIRFYAINPVAETATVEPSPRLRMLVVSFGLSFR